MRLMPLENVVPGMRLAKSIYNQDGMVLLSENVELTHNLMQALKRHGFLNVYISEPSTDDITFLDPISDETRLRAISEIRLNFRKVMDENNRKRLPSYHLGKSFSNVMTMIIDDLSSHQDAMIMLTNICIVDHYLYQHSLNVCIYATLLGIAYGYSRDELMTLGLGALLHDIGKTLISPNLLQKPGELSDDEYDAVKKHSELGFSLLKDEPIFLCFRPTAPTSTMKESTGRISARHQRR